MMLSILALIAAQAAPAGSPTPAATPSPAPMPSSPIGAPAPAATPSPNAAPVLPRVIVNTASGSFVIEIDTRRAPITAANFLRYVDQKRLDGVTVYRVSHVAPRFGFIQFGMNGDPKRSLPPIRHEPTTQTGIRHLDLTISTARLEPGTARGEFTIMLGDQPGLDADPNRPGDNLGYAAFGHVVEGGDTILAIFDAPLDPAATVRGAFKGEVPVAPVRIVTARRVPPGAAVRP